MDYQYDDLNRLTTQTYSDDQSIQSISYSYDANNNLLTVSVEDGDNETISFTNRYDHFDRLISQTDAHGFEHSYSYDVNGNRTQYSYDDDVTSYQYDDVNRLISLRNQGQSSDYSYYLDGRLNTIDHSNNTESQYRYTDRGLIKSIDHLYNGTSLALVEYAYDDNDNRTDQWETNGRDEEHTQYQFDDLDRLTDIQYPDVPAGEGMDVVYSYDAVGNRLSEVYTNQAVDAVVQQRSYSYNDRNQLTTIADELDSSQDISFSYDANGNQTGKTQDSVTTTYNYDLRNHMIAVIEDSTTLQTARYDHQGLRIESITADGTRLYSYDGQSPVAIHDGDNNLINAYQYGPYHRDRILDPNLGIQYYHPDAQGSPLAISGNSGAIVARYAYDAFGQYRRREQTNTENPFGFTGHEYDEATGLIYAKARFYDAETARFLSQDPFEGDLNNPPSLHQYLYGYQNPTVYVDPDGKEACYGRPLEGCPEPTYIPDGESVPQNVADDALSGGAEMTEVAMDKVDDYLQSHPATANNKLSIYSRHFTFVPHYDEHKDVLFYNAIATDLKKSAYIVPPAEIDQFISEEDTRAIAWSLSHDVAGNEMPKEKVAYARMMERGVFGQNGSDAAAFTTHLGEFGDAMLSVDYAARMTVAGLAGYVGAGLAGKAPVRLSPYRTTVENEVNAIQSLGSSQRLRYGIDPALPGERSATKADYKAMMSLEGQSMRLNQELGNTIKSQKYVYRYTTLETVQKYYMPNANNPNGGILRESFMTTDYLGLDQRSVMSQAQILDAWGAAPDVLVKVPVANLKSYSVPRPFGNSYYKGYEPNTSSYPAGGSGGVNQFMGTVDGWDNSWLFYLKK